MLVQYAMVAFRSDEITAQHWQEEGSKFGVSTQFGRASTDAKQLLDKVIVIEMTEPTAWPQMWGMAS